MELKKAALLIVVLPLTMLLANAAFKLAIEPFIGTGK